MSMKVNGFSKLLCLNNVQTLMKHDATPRAALAGHPPDSTCSQVGSVQ